MAQEDIEFWRQHAKDMNAMRNRRRYQFRGDVQELRNVGFDVKEISAFQFRINDRLDIFPSNKRFHDIKTMKRGDIGNGRFCEFVKEYFGINGMNI